MTKEHRVNARINAKTAAKVSRLRKESGETTSQLIERAIDQLDEASASKRADEAAERFIGCFEGDATNLSTDYKQIILDGLLKKHGYR
jgi:Ribbon-helix-helix protein, copG family